MNPQLLGINNIRNLEFHIQRKENDYKAHLAVVPLKNFSIVADHVHNILHPMEMVFFKRLLVDKRKASFSMGRYAAKIAASRFITEEENLSKIEVASGIFGNPLVRYPSHDIPFVCITHDDQYAVSIAYPDVHPMSIDLESIHDDKIPVIKSQCSLNEIKLYDKLSISEATFYTLLWTIKEAISKAIRCGLTIPLKLLSIKNFRLINGNEYVSDFTNFGQYKAYSFILNNHVFSLALPIKSKLIVNYSELKEALK